MGISQCKLISNLLNPVCNMLNLIIWNFNLQAQPSPTTGKFPFGTSGNSQGSMMIKEVSGSSKDNLFEDVTTSSFAFKPDPDLRSATFTGAGAASKVSKNYTLFFFSFLFNF